MLSARRFSIPGAVDRNRRLLRSIAVVGLLATVAIGGTPAAVAAAGANAGEIPITTSSKAAKKMFLKAQELLDVGRGVEANRLFVEATERDPDFAYAYLNVGNSALSFPQFQQALEQANKLLEGKSRGEQLLIEIAGTFLTNDTDQGVRLAEQLVEAYPESVRARIALATMHANRNDHEAARAAWTKARMREPNAVVALTGLGFSYLFNEPKDFSKAEMYMQKFIDVAPREAKAFEGFGDVKRAQNDLSAALDAYDRATRLDPDLAQAQLKKGHVNSFLGRIPEARRAYDSAIASASPESKASYANYRAFTHLHGGDVDAALDELDRIAESVEAMGTPAHQVKGVQVFTLTNSIRVALHHRMLDRAAQLVEKRSTLVRAIGEEIGTEDAKRLQEANALSWEGLLAAYRGDSDTALAKAEKLSTLVADDQNARKLEPYHQIVGAVHLERKDYRQAVEHLTQANLANQYVKYQLALAEMGIGEARKALERLAEVASWNFNSVDFALVRKLAAEQSAQPLVTESRAGA